MKEIRLAVKRRKAEGASNIEIMEEVLEALKETAVETDVPETKEAVEATVSDEELIRKITEMIHEIGIPAHLKGHNYLRDSIVLCLKTPSIIDSVIKELYPKVAKKNATTVSRVERAIRHAIQVAWERGDIGVLNSYFGYTIDTRRGRPTNAEFIAMMADKLRLKYKLS